MDDLSDKFKKTPQKMSEKRALSPMMAEACGKIRIADLCDATEKIIEIPEIGPLEGLTKMPKYSTDSEMKEIIKEVPMSNR